MSFAPGSYVSYKGTTYIITKDFGDSVKLASHQHSTAPRAKYSAVKALNIQPAVVVKNNIDGRIHAVTAKNNIFSLASGKMMKWSSTNGNRTNIIASAGIARFKRDEGVKADATIQESIDAAKCGRCGGLGYISAFKGYNDGVCYACHGKG